MRIRKTLAGIVLPALSAFFCPPAEPQSRASDCKWLAELGESPNKILFVNGISPEITMSMLIQINGLSKDEAAVVTAAALEEGKQVPGVYRNKLLSKCLTEKTK